ncbi:MAG: glycosyltransferase involved in cell wall biosynthesis [Methylophagaceae bacterium]|jgi:glycosyltransferase involved in cell wall biosynthesis
MKIAIITDAWEPQINDIVTTLKATSEQLKKMGHTVTVLSHIGHKTMATPGYKSIKLALFPFKKLTRDLETINPDAIHIATEGPLGFAARRWCLENNITFTTSYHTQFPEYLRLHLPIPISWIYAWFRLFHSKAIYTLVATESQKGRLKRHGFRHLKVWGRGVDTETYNPTNQKQFNYPKPVMVYVGRLAVEKNIEAFLSLELPGTKLVIGDGPDLVMLKQRFPTAIFTGSKSGHELASWVAGGDVFVFPSKTDTFGLVNFEAMACGLPVAAYPVIGPKDIIIEGFTGSINDDLKVAINNALFVNPQNCLEYAKQNTWTKTSHIFACYLHTGRTSSPKRSLFDIEYMKLSI